jgi:hypothetical protein
MWDMSESVKKYYDRMAAQDGMVESMEEIYKEVERAKNKFSFWPNDIIHAAAIVNEESGELIRAALQFNYEGGNIEDAKKEAIQTAAMCVRFLENLNKYTLHT